MGTGLGHWQLRPLKTQRSVIDSYDCEGLQPVEQAQA